MQATSESTGSLRYDIDSAASTVHILVYRGGTLARLGHNHVISSRGISGSIWQGASLDASGFAITVPVNDLIVDDTAARAAQGEDFAQAVSEEAKQGTKINMLRETLLDGARYPDISLRSVSLHGDTGAVKVVVALKIKDQTRHMTVPVRLHNTDNRLRVTGEFEHKQTDFGITPLNVALGALLVLDTVKIKFELVTQTPCITDCSDHTGTQAQ